MESEVVARLPIPPLCGGANSHGSTAQVDATADCLVVVGMSFPKGAISIVPLVRAHKEKVSPHSCMYLMGVYKLQPEACC